MTRSFDPMDLRGQEQAEADARDEAKLEAKVEEEDLKWVMSNKRGRRFVWRLLDRAGIYRSSFTGNSTTFFNEGQRNIGLMLVAAIHEACPDQYLAMIKEQKHGRDSDDASRK
ncbi:MAG: endopeptidase [Proteobacteria bacterium]|nr:endopeptidase [Pseudomonadota bacterium]